MSEIGMVVETFDALVAVEDELGEARELAAKALDRANATW